MLCPLVLAYVTLGGPFLSHAFPAVGAPAWLRALALALGVLCVATPFWRLFRYSSTLSHELSHLCCAALLGGSVRHIKIRLDASGVAAYAAPEEFGRARHVLVASAGYLGPAIVGFSGAWSVVQQRAVPWLLCVAAVCCVSVLLFLRNIWGILCVGSLAGLLVLGVERATDFTQVGIVTVLSSALLCGGVRDSRGQKHVPQGAGTDAEKIASLLPVSAASVCRTLEIACEMAALCGFVLLVFS
jgi:hypothetical protein